MRTGLAASTVTPGRTAPDVSFTTPAMVLCADATAGASVSSARPIQIRTQPNPRMMNSLPEPNGRRSAPECDADGLPHIVRDCESNVKSAFSKSRRGGHASGGPFQIDGCPRSGRPPLLFRGGEDLDQGRG